jgi:CBS-domain-containing membrane protein
VVDDARQLLGVMTRRELGELGQQGDASQPLAALVRPKVTVAHPDEPLRVVVHRMAQTGLTRFPVVKRGARELCGMVSLDDLLKARSLNLEAEHRRERVSPLHLFFPRLARRPPTAESAQSEDRAS